MFLQVQSSSSIFKKTKKSEPAKDETTATKDDIDRALARFIFGCNIALRVVESIHLKEFISCLNSNYVPPSRTTLSKSLLDKVYTETMNDRIQCLKDTESVLLIDGWKNSSANTKNVVCCIYNEHKKLFFLESYDLTEVSETAMALEEIVNKAVTLAKEVYCTTIYAVISDNASAMIAMGRSVNLWHSTCNSHSGNLLAKSLVDNEFAKKVNSLLKEFKNPGLEKEI